MASTVYDVVSIELLDGTVIECRPLKIKLLREFMKTFAKMDGEGVRDDNDKAIKVLLDCAAVAFKQYAPNYSTTDLEDVLDMQTLNRVLEIASGMKFGGEEGNA